MFKKFLSQLSSDTRLNEDARFDKFEHRPPSPQNAIDIFSGKWASNLEAIWPGAVAGDAFHFTSEPRILHAAKHFGQSGRFDGMSVLDLGPLEGGIAYGLEKLGANVLAIEANSEAYLKCLIVKEIANMRSTRFVFGNFVEYLKTTTDRYDLVFASGVLYHMKDPIELIELIARVTDRCLLWSHVYNKAIDKGPTRTLARTDPRYGGVRLWSLDYGKTPNTGRFWGGIDSYSLWMEADDVLSVFRANGFDQIALQPMTHSLHGVICFAASKSR